MGEWKVEDVVKQGEDRIEFEKVLGYQQHNRAGLGFIKQTEVPPKQTHDYRKLVSDKVHDLEEEWYFAKAVQLRLQGNWTRWCNYIQNELSWKHLLVISHCILSMFAPPLMFSPGCKVALSQGRYTFRHDSILIVLHDSLSKFLSSMSAVKACLSLSSCFVKQGKRFCASKKKPHVGIFHVFCIFCMFIQAFTPPLLILYKTLQCNV